MKNKHPPSTDNLNSNISKVIKPIASGTAIAIAFNPLDRALFLAQHHHRGFWQIKNFTTPFQGMPEVILQRILSNGIYFFSQSELRNIIDNSSNDYFKNSVTADFSVGFGAGLIASFTSTPVKAIKAYRWGRNSSCPFENISSAYSQSGIHAFSRGALGMMGRDIVWGTNYEVLRRVLNSRDSSNSPFYNIFANSVAAGSATIVAAPFNFVVNQRYRCDIQNKPQPSLQKILQSLTHPPDKGSPMLYAFKRLQLGIGTVRVMAGITLGQAVSDCDYSKILEKLGKCSL